MSRKIAVLAAFAILGCSQSAEQQSAATAAVTADSPGSRIAGSADRDTVKDSRADILFLGTSLTAGYGVGAENAFPALIQQKVDSAGLPFHVINAGLSGETSAGGLRRIDWSLQQHVDVLVLELGANDGLRGLSVMQMRANLDSIMAHARRKYPDVEILIAGMEAPPNLGATYTSAFRQTFIDLAKKYDAKRIPFLLAGVATVPSLNQEDGIHPNDEGHRRIANTVWKELYPMLVRITATTAAAATR